MPPRQVQYLPVGRSSMYWSLWKFSRNNVLLVYTSIVNYSVSGARLMSTFCFNIFIPIIFFYRFFFQFQITNNLIYRSRMQLVYICIVPQNWIMSCACLSFIYLKCSYTIRFMIWVLYRRVCRYVNNVIS